MTFRLHIMIQIRNFLGGIRKKIGNFEMSIRKKWNSAVLPLANIILKKYREKDKFFNPEKFLEKLDNEKYCELLKT